MAGLVPASRVRGVSKRRGLQRTASLSRCALGNVVTGLLTIVLCSVTYSESNLALRDAVRVMPGRQGRGRCPRARPHQLRSRAVRASCLPALRPACEVRRWKWSDRRRSDPRPLDGVPTKPGPDRTKGPHTPWEEPWWNAGRRARPKRTGGASRLLRGATAPVRCGTDDSATAGVPLSLLFAGPANFRSPDETKCNPGAA